MEQAHLPLANRDLEANKMTKKRFAREIEATLDKYAHIKLTPEEALIVGAELKAAAHGSVARTPLTCVGDLCPFRDYCAFYKIGKHPLGEDCIQEAQLLTYWRMQYMEAYQVDPNDFNEVDQINELAETEIMLSRINMQLKRPEEASLVTEQVIGITPQGKKITEMRLSPYYEARERLLARKSKIRKLLVGDRQEQYKKQAALKKREDKDPSTISADQKNLLNELIEIKRKQTAQIESTDGYQVVLTSNQD